MRRWSIVLVWLFACTSEPTRLPIAPEVQPDAPAPRGEIPDPLVFGITPYLSAKQMQEEFSPLVQYLGVELGLKTRLRVAKDYFALEADVAKGKAHIAIFSPFSYVRAKPRLAGLQLLATHIADGSSTYSAYIIAREDSGVRAVNDLAGKRFAFVDRGSTSGYVYPLAYLRNLGHDETFFGSVTFAGDHTKVVQMVIAGEADAGATFSTPYNNAADQGLTIVAKVGRIPYDAYCASPGLDPPLAQRVRQALLGLSTRDEAGRQVLGKLTHINGFVAVDDGHYDEVRRVARLNERTLTSP